MENDREVDSVLMNVKNTTGEVISAISFSARMSLKLLSFMARLAKKGLIASGICDRFQDFHTKTGGEYTTYNIPLSQEKSKLVKEMQNLELNLEKEKNPVIKMQLKKRIEKIENQIPEVQQLKRLGITYCVLPKVNGSMNTIQVGIARKDDQHFKNWFLNHLTTNMSGGEKSLEALKVFTEGNYSVFNMPFEEAEELGVMLSDFRTMGINYAILPDLDVGDGFTQIAVSNSERSQVEKWFNMWKQKALMEGKEIKDMYEMDADSYTSTAELTPDDFINRAEPEIKAVQNDFETESNPVPWKARLSKDNSPEFVKLMQDSNYEKITINIEKLVNDRVGNAATKALEQTGFFVSRVPGTYGQKEENLVVPSENVFVTDENKTAIAFLDKRKDYMIINHAGITQKKSTADIQASYDTVDRGLKKAEALTKAKDLAQNLSKVPTPAKPIL